MSANEKTGPTPETGHPQNADGDKYTRDHADILAASSGFAVLVESGEGKYRRRLFLTLAAAQKAVERAHNNGKFASLVLVRVVPVEVVS